MTKINRPDSQRARRTTMSETGARRIVLAARPEGRPKDSAFRLERIPVPTSRPRPAPAENDRKCIGSRNRTGGIYA